MDEYTSEFQAPIHSIINVREVGLQVVRTVVMDEEIMEFAVDRHVYFAGVDKQSDELESE